MGCKQCRFEIGINPRGTELPEALRAHLESCAACAEFARECQATWTAVATLGELQAPTRLRNGIRERLRQERTRPSPVNWREAWSNPVLPARQAYMAAPALVVLILVLGVAIHGLMPATGIDMGSFIAVGPLTNGGTMPTSFVTPMVHQHQGLVTSSPWQHDAGYFVATND